MTRAAFLARLAHTPRTWKVDSGGLLRNAAKACPVCAVEPSGQYFICWPEARRLLGLSFDDAAAIAKAADSDTGVDQALRQQLLVATGLAEKESGT